MSHEHGTAESRPVRRGLGRGLGALIPTGPRPDEADAAQRGQDSADQTRPGPGAGPGSGVGLGVGSGASAWAGGEGSAAEATLVRVEGASFAELPLDAIRPNQWQPREVFDEEAMAELVFSIREVGLLQPVVVRPLEEPDEAGHTYELVMGERRWRASREAGLPAIPAIVRETGDDVMLRDALLENLHRSQLNPLEEAAAYGQLLEDFSCTHDELAQRIGRSRPQISNTLRLLKLSPAVQRRVAAGVLSAGHARALLGIEDADQQDRMAQRVVAEGISVRGLEEMVAVGDSGGVAARREVRRRPVAPGLTELADRLSDRLETRVKVDLGRSRGKVTVEFATLDDLRRIVEIIDPQTSGRG